MRQRLANYAVATMTVYFILFMVGCATSLHIKSLGEMTPLEKATLAAGIYNDKVDDYRIKVALPNLSPAEKTVLQTEYQIFQKAWPMIDAYYKAAKGTGPSVSTATIEYINTFLATYRY